MSQKEDCIASLSHSTTCIEYNNRQERTTFQTSCLHNKYIMWSKIFLLRFLFALVTILTLIAVSLTSERLTNDKEEGDEQVCVDSTGNSYPCANNDDDNKLDLFSILVPPEVSSSGRLVDTFVPSECFDFLPSCPSAVAAQPDRCQNSFKAYLSCPESCGLCKSMREERREHVYDNDFYPNCQQIATEGGCDHADIWKKCASTCNSSYYLEPATRCQRPPWGGDRDHRLSRPGALNEYFREIVASHPQFSPTVLANPEEHDTNVVLFDSLLTRADVRLLRDERTLCPRGFQRSIMLKDANERNKSVSEEDESSPARVSETCWVNSPASSNKRVRKLEQKIAKFLGFPVNNSESIQLLRYGAGGYYREHTDFLQGNSDAPWGVRVLTLFIYLNDVSEGGRTLFPSLNLSVKPKAGRVVLWQNVKDGRFNFFDAQTRHTAEEVGEGEVKLSANYWTHLYDYRSFEQMKCLPPFPPGLNDHPQEVYRTEDGQYLTTFPERKGE